MEEMRYVYKSSVGKCEEKRPLGSLRLRWEDSIRIHVKVFWVVTPCSVVAGY
jgi:hypothetical protein